MLNQEVLPTPQRTKKLQKMGMVETISAKERRTGFNWVTKGPVHPEEAT